MNPKVTIVGHVCIDENTVNGERTVRWGSPLLYMADYFIKRHNIRPTLIAPHGKDLGYYADASLLLNRPTGSRTLRYNNDIRHHVRTQSCTNIRGARPVKLTSGMKEVLRSTDIFIFAPLLPNYKKSYLRALDRYLPAGCLKIILPQGYFRNVKTGQPITKREFKESSDILSHFTTLIQSDEDIDLSEQKAKGWSELFPDLHVIVTRNKKGSIDFRKGIGSEVPTIEASDEVIKNPIGVGDIFSASFAYYFQQSGDKQASIVKAHRDAYESLTGRR